MKISIKIIDIRFVIKKVIIKDNDIKIKIIIVK